MDDVPIGLLFFSLLLLIACSAFFSASETAMMSLNRYRLKHLTESGHRSARYASMLLASPERLLGTILLGNNLANVAAASITTILAIRLFGDVAIAVAGFVLTIVLLVFAEVPPKTLASKYPEKIAFPAAHVLRVLVKLAWPAVALINGAGRVITSNFGKDDSDSGQVHRLNADELSTAVRESGEDVPQSHQDMLLRILDLERITIGDVMVPRSSIEAVDLEDEWDEIKSQLATAHHTRIPVYKGSLDNVVGTLHMRRVLHLIESEGDDATLEDLMPLVREPYFVPEDARVTQQLLALQDERRQMGLVVDEYGDLKGVATLDDILEEIVGEYTAQVPGISEDVHVEADGSFMVNGAANVRDLNRRMNWQLPTDGPKTLNGLIVEYFEDIPQTGTSLRLGDYTLEIVQTRGTGVTVARIRTAQPAGETDYSSQAASA